MTECITKKCKSYGTKMKFGQLLGVTDWFDGELIVKDSYESMFSFCWDGGTVLTKSGKERFWQMLQSDIIVSDGIIILQDVNISQDDYDLFMSATAGYIRTTLYDKWFEEVKKND